MSRQTSDAASAPLFALAAAPSQAASKRIFEETFGSAAQPTFEAAQGMAIDYDDGDLYVIDAKKGPGKNPAPKNLNPAIGTGWALGEGPA